jgi:hypothetical protein
MTPAIFRPVDGCSPWKAFPGVTPSAKPSTATSFQRLKTGILALYHTGMGKGFTLLAGLSLSAGFAAYGHDIITTPITWDREISRIVYDRCASCHHDGGQAFSLMTYAVARPWAVAIKEEVLERRMPPWGAVKGFGDFRNDKALTPEQMELISSWVGGGVPEGEAKDLPPDPKPDQQSPQPPSHGTITAGPELEMRKAFLLDGILPKSVPENASFQITAELPDGSIVPLLWFEHYRAKFSHPFLYRNPVELPSGAKIHGVPPGASVLLLPAAPATTAATPTP